jgi:hypothetical protein
MACEVVYTLPPLILKHGKFEKTEPSVVGLVDHDGNIVGTDYSFRNRHVVGGVAISKHTQYIKQGQVLVDPLTGEEFKETKKGGSFFNKLSGLLVKPYAAES